MNKRSHTLLFIALLFALPLSAQRNREAAPYRLPANLPVSKHMLRHLERQANAISAYNRHIASHQKTAAAERLLARADYVYQGAGNPIMSDSQRIVYSGNRSAAFDFFWLNYSFYNETDYPHTATPGIAPAYIQFDTVFRYTAPNAAPAVQAYRVYNAAGKVLHDEDSVSIVRTYFTYNSNNQLVRTTTMGYGANGVFDSSSRSFYTYNAAGFVIKDSTEEWDANSGTWTAGLVTNHVVDAAGLLQQSTANINFFSTSVPVFQTDYAYNSGKVVLNTFKVFNGIGMPLANYFRDTFVYTSNTLSQYGSYSWDTATNNWVLAYAERRRLNTANLPDSTWSYSYENGAVTDTFNRALTYNANGNPTLQRIYNSTGTELTNESRYYYSITTPPPTAVRTSATGQLIAVYPNPARDALQVKGISSGRFAIMNALGQVMVTGNLAAQNSIISVQGLPAGTYTLLVEDAQGGQSTARFVRE